VPACCCCCCCCCCRYHDEEWGRPLHDDSKLFELLILEGAQVSARRNHHPMGHCTYDCNCTSDIDAWPAVPAHVTCAHRHALSSYRQASDVMVSSRGGVGAAVPAGTCLALMHRCSQMSWAILPANVNPLAAALMPTIRVKMSRPPVGIFPVTWTGVPRTNTL
jgi:hypothetical protein